MNFDKVQLEDIDITFPPSTHQLQDYDGDGVVSAKDILIYIVLCLLMVLAGFFK